MVKKKSINKSKRYSAPTVASRLFSLAVHVLSIPQIPTDAVFVVTGEGERERIISAVREFNRGRARFLLIAPFNTSRVKTQAISVSELRRAPYNLKRTKGIIIGNFAAQTRDQAIWLHQMVIKHSIRSVSIHNVQYHIVRSYLTVLKYFLDKQTRIPLVPVLSVRVPSNASPASGLASWTLIHGEAARIHRYQMKGHVATIEELQKYLTWLFRKVDME